ncbi:MAG TPA: DMT family transporter [Thermoanaerobaculia bacterium]|nr:DMT family transporter [Thermoanaerobaculia bacterium]HXT51399.1 DMT family transporter [Thermoanaerobaculia bacterium]
MSAARDPLLSARLRLLAAAALFSTGPTAIKACGLGPWQVAGFRSGTAALFLFVLLRDRRRLLKPRLWLVGAAYSGTLVSYAIATKLTTAANAIFLQSTFPVYLLLLSPLLLHEKPRRSDLVFLLAVMGGMALLLLGDVETTSVATDPVRGNLLSLISGLLWAVTLLGLRWLERGTPEGDEGLGQAAVVAGNAIAFVACLPMALPLGPSRPVDWLLIAFLGVVQIGVSYLLLTRAMGRVSALEAGLLLMFEPVLTPLWAWAVHGERPGAWALAGGAVILAAMVWRTIHDSTRPRPVEIAAPPT